MYDMILFRGEFVSLQTCFTNGCPSYIIHSSERENNHTSD